MALSVYGYKYLSAYAFNWVSGVGPRCWHGLVVIAHWNGGTAGEHVASNKDRRRSNRLGWSMNMSIGSDDLPEAALQKDTLISRAWWMMRGSYQ
jgi:hypothetical protein